MLPESAMRYCLKRPARGRDAQPAVLENESLSQRRGLNDTVNFEPTPRTAMSSLRITCPHCHEEHDDPFEVLASDQLHSMLCEGCGARFWLAIMECHRCAAEQTFTWGHQPEVAALDLLTCDPCGSTFRYHDAETEQERSERL